MICLTGGGTGGHLATIRTLKTALVAAGEPVMFIGSSRGLDVEWMRDEPGLAAAHFLPSHGVMGRRLPEQLRALGQIAWACARAHRLLRQGAVQAVLSVGAYAAAPAGMAAALAGIPLFLHEHNVHLGRLHRLLAPHACAVYSSFSPQSPVRDYPLDDVCFQHRRVRTRARRILFLGGSQGARGINDFALRSAPWLAARGLEVAHQAGRRDHARVAAAYRELGVDVDLVDFDPKLGERMAWADLAVSRAGGTTVWELAAHGLPALFVPFPHAVDDHQYANAHHFASRALGWVAREEELEVGHLDRLLEIDLEPVSRGLIETIAPGGARRMAAHLLAALR